MKAEIIKIGNSKGLRIPKAFLKQCGMKDVVSLKIENTKLVISPWDNKRAGWDENFQTMAKNKDDHLLEVDSIKNSWDEEEWQW